MRFGMFSPSTSPIAIDFGSSCVKILQTTTGEKPTILAAAELSIPDHLRLKSEELWKFYAAELPRLIKKGGFKGKRAVCCVPGYQTIAQHLQVEGSEGVKKGLLAQSQLQMQVGAAPNSLVVRTFEVADIHRNGQVRTEMICFAMPRDIVMRYVDVLKKCKLEVAGVHSGNMATLRAFDHIYRREGDDALTTVYIELGWGSTNVSIAHGTKLVFARTVQLGGQHFDRRIAEALECDPGAARGHRLSMNGLPAATASNRPESGTRSSAEEPGGGGMARLNAAMQAESRSGTDHASSAAATAAERRTNRSPGVLPQEVAPGDGPHSAANVDFGELIDTMADELSMCVRYHRGLFPDRPIDRAILLGGESRQMWLCQQLAKALQLPARLGDPLARFNREASAAAAPAILNGTPQPGWAVPCGLCVIPTDF